MKLISNDYCDRHFILKITIFKFFKFVYRALNLGRCFLPIQIKQRPSEPNLLLVEVIPSQVPKLVEHQEPSLQNFQAYQVCLWQAEDDLSSIADYAVLNSSFDSVIEQVTLLSCCVVLFKPLKLRDPDKIILDHANLIPQLNLLLFQLLQKDKIPSLFKI